MRQPGQRHGGGRQGEQQAAEQPRGGRLASRQRGGPVRPVIAAPGPGGRARAAARPGPAAPDAEHVAERGQRGQFAAAAVHGGTGRGRRRAQVHAAQRGPVRVPPGHRPGQHLAHGLRAAGDVPADVVGVHRLLLRRGPGVPRQHQVGEPGGEPLDLGLDPRGHVHRGPRRDVAVGPQRVLAAGRPARVGDARLDHEHVRRLRVLAAGHLRPRRRLSPRTRRRGAGSRPAAPPRSATAPGRTGRSRPCRCRPRSGTWPARRGTGRAAVRPPGRGRRAGIRPAAPRAPAAARPATAPSGRSPPGRRR